MEIAVIGSGISGMSASLFLSRNNNVTLYEKNDYLGGHSNTKKINYNSKKINVDTGFIVFNELNYPNLLKLFNHYNVVYEESDMSLSVSNLHNGLEWSGQNLGTIFLDKRRFFNYKFIRFVFDILKFNLQVKRNIQLFSKNNETLEDWLKNKNFSQQFKEANEHLSNKNVELSKENNKLSEKLKLAKEGIVKIIKNHKEK